MIQINRNKIIIFNIFVIPILMCLWIIALFDVLSLNRNYRACTVLPFLFIVGYTVFFIMKKNILDIHLLILLLFFVKLYIFPMLVIGYGGFDISKYNSNLEQNIFDAILLQMLEWIAVFIGIIIIRFKKREKASFEVSTDKVINANIWKIIAVCFFIVIVAVVIYPSLLYKFRPIFFSSETLEILWKQNSTVAVSTISAMIYYPINWLIIITRLTLVYAIVIFVWKKRRKKSSFISVLISFVIIIIGLVLIVPDDVAASIIAAFCLLIILTKLYPQKSKYLVTIVLLAGVFFFIYVFFGKVFLEHTDINESILFLNQRINAYFSGFVNMAGSLEMNSNNKMVYFLGDFLRSLPILKGYFIDMPTTTELFNLALGYDPIYNSQIIPLEGQAYFYFRWLGVIVVPIIEIKICSIFYNKMSEAKGTYDYFINSFYTLIIGMGIVMYDGFLIFYLCLSYIPLLIINMFIKRKGKNT